MSFTNKFIKPLLRKLAYSKTTKATKANTKSSKNLKTEGNPTSTRDEYALLSNHKLFDGNWYSTTYLTGKATEVEASQHFLSHVIEEETDPSPYFSSKNYFLTYPDVKHAKLNPLLHYIKHGIKEGRIYLPRDFNPFEADTKLVVKLIAESGLFDKEWYRTEYTDVAEAKIDPIEHYVNNGAREGRNPSPTFYSYFYLSQLREEGLHDINPLLHYIYIGKESNLRASPNGLKICSPLPSGTLLYKPEQTFTIAVMAHVYYEDMMPRIVNKLQNIPFKFTLLVSTTSDNKRQSILDSCSNLTEADEIDIRVFPNRGRDIAPLVVGFAKECMAHDYVLHIHSKKSPYGSETEGWFDYCMDHLLDSPLYVDSIFRRFEENKSLGLIYPPPLPSLRNHLHWENMQENGKRLLERMCISPEIINEFPLEFPAGSMIWFRSSALKPLFNCDLSWDDFPEEESQKNGTLAHVIERLFFYIAHHKLQHYQATRPAAEHEYFIPLISNETNNSLKLQISEQPLVSIILPVYNQWSYTQACINSICSFTDPHLTPFELILADDGSTDQTTNATEHYPKIKHIRTSKNLGFLGNCNNAAQYASGKYLVLLNNDTQVQPKWLTELVESFQTKPDAAIVGSKLIYPDGTLQEAGGVIWKNAGGLNYGRNSNPSLPEYCYLKSADYISGAAIAIRKSFWDSIEGFDERFIPAYYEDTDICFEARKRGYGVYLQPASLVVHFEGKSHGTDTNSGIKKHQVINKEKFLQKWRKTLQLDHTDGSQLMHARERSMGKKIIAVLDYYLPEYDRHAGARHTLTYVKLLLDKGYVVKFLASFIDNERQLKFAAELQQMGVEVLYPEIYYFEQNWSSWLSEQREYLNAVLINRPHVFHMHADICKQSNIPILYFCHDLHSLRNYREAIRQGDESKAERAKADESTEIDIFKLANFSYTPSKYEADYLNDKHRVKNVSYLPLYYNSATCKYRKKAPKGMRVIFVGGMHHAPNHDAVIWFLDNVWPSVSNKLPQAQLRLVGNKPSEDILKHASDSVKILGSISDDELNKEYIKAKVIVAPLQYGAGVKGKTLEALQIGTPLIATSIAAEGIPGIESILDTVDSPEEYSEVLIKSLVMLESDWLNISRQYTDFARELLSIEKAWKYFSQGLEAIGLEGK